MRKSKAIELLSNALASIDDLKEKRYDSSAFKKWLRDTEVAIENIFGNETRHMSDFQKIRYSPPISNGMETDSTLQEWYIEGLDSTTATLQSMIEEVEEYWEDEVPNNFQANKTADKLEDQNKVFIIHGHDEGVKETIARFVERIGLRPIILHEEANRGRTIIEKFEDHSSVGFAVAILTPDDICVDKDARENHIFRARQNVVFELGYFMGSLGRDHVCALIKGDLELPSDYSGVVYIQIDSAGAWKHRFVAELKAAGIAVDANRAF